MGQEAFMSSGTWFFLLWAVICPFIALVASQVQARNEKRHQEKKEQAK